MIKPILDLLMQGNHENQSELIEFAKGSQEIPTTWKKGFKQIKRIVKWRKHTR